MGFSQLMTVHSMEMNISSSNSAQNDGGVFCTEQSNLKIIDWTLFTDNIANKGRVIWADRGTLAHPSK